MASTDGDRRGPRAVDAELLAQVYDELRKLAQSRLAALPREHTLQATALVHEAWLRIAGPAQGPWNSRAHFFGVAAKAMRHVLVDHARAKQADKRGGDWKRVTLSAAIAAGEPEEVDVLTLEEALTKLAALDDRKARIVEMRFFAGMTAEEVAEVLDISLATVQRESRVARAWLGTELAEGFEP